MNASRSTNLIVDLQAAQAPVVWWSSCEIRVMANTRFCVGIFATALRNKINSPPQILQKNTSPTFTVHRLLSDHLLCWKEPILANYPFLGYYIHKWSPRLHTPFPNTQSEKQIIQAHNYQMVTNPMRIQAHILWFWFPHETNTKLQFG